MKHIKTFESFLNESLIEKKEELYIAHVDDSRKPGGSDKDIKKTYNLEVRDRDRDGFDIVGSKEDIQAFVDEYNIILVDDIESIDEANDLSYWKDYAEGSNQSPKWYNNEAKNPSAVNKLVDTVVNYELDQMDDKDADIDPSDMKTLTDLAMKYFKKFGSINGHIVSAMLFQEAKESVINEGKAPKTWDSMFAMKVIAAFKNKEIDPNDPKSIEKWDTAFNGGKPPRPPFETAAIIKYYQETGKGPDGKP